MKRILLFLSAFLAFFILANIGVVHASDVLPDVQLTKQDLKDLNPLTKSDVGDVLSTPNGIISRVLYFAIPLAGLILFVMLVWGGFEILSGAATAKSKDAGKQRVTAAITGFFLLFASYWIVQLIQVVFGVRILQ